MYMVLLQGAKDYRIDPYLFEACEMDADRLCKGTQPEAGNVQSCLVWFASYYCKALPIPLCKLDYGTGSNTHESSCKTWWHVLRRKICSNNVH